YAGWTATPPRDRVQCLQIHEERFIAERDSPRRIDAAVHGGGGGGGGCGLDGRGCAWRGCEDLGRHVSPARRRRRVREGAKPRTVLRAGKAGEDRRNLECARERL